MTIHEIIKEWRLLNKCCYMLSCSSWSHASSAFMGSMPLTLQGSRGSWLSPLPLPLLAGPLVALGPADMPLLGSASGVGATLPPPTGTLKLGRQSGQDEEAMRSTMQLPVGLGRFGPVLVPVLLAVPVGRGIRGRGRLGRLRWG